MSNENFIKFIRDSQESDFLQEHHPNAFLLLCLIAKRARRISGKPDGLEIGEALIGDFKKAGLKTRGQYRHALEILIGRAHIKKVETCRTRKKATTGTTTEGTKVNLLKSDIWDINPETNNHRNNHRTTTEQPPNNHEQECKEYKELIPLEKNYTKKEIPKANATLQEPKMDLQVAIENGEYNIIYILGLSDKDHSNYVDYIKTQFNIDGEIIMPEVYRKAFDYLSKLPKKEAAVYPVREKIISWVIPAVMEEKNRVRKIKIDQQILDKKENYVTKISPKETNQKNARKYFISGEIYNGAICHIDDQAISFERGTNHRKLLFSENGFDSQFSNLLNHFGILLPESKIQQIGVF